MIIPGRFLHQCEHHSKGGFIPVFSLFLKKKVVIFLQRLGILVTISEIW